MHRAALLACVLAACGRIGFDTPGSSTLGPDADPQLSFSPAGCPASYTLTLPSSNHRYRYNTTLLTFPDAAATCAADDPGGTEHTHLVVVNSTAELGELGEAASNDSPWLGLTDRATEGVWLPVTLENVGGFPMLGEPPWADGEPNNEGAEHCAEIKDGTLLNDLGCLAQDSYICECDGYADQPARYPARADEIPGGD